MRWLDPRAESAPPSARWATICTRPTACSYYAHPVVWDQAWWVPLLFAGASPGGRRRRHADPPALRRARVARRRRRARSPATGIAFAVAYAVHLVRAGRSAERDAGAAGRAGGWRASSTGARPWLIAYSLVMAVGRHGVRGRPGRRSASSTITIPTSPACRAGCRASTCTRARRRPARARASRRR